MTTKTALIIGGAVVVGVGVLAWKSSASTTPKPSSSSSTFNLGGLVSAAGAGIVKGIGELFSSQNAAPVSASQNLTLNDIRDFDAAGVSSYDAQGTADQPVYGIAGLDY